MTRFFHPLNLLQGLLIMGAATTLAQIPVVSSFAPSSGPPGTIITASGSNFSPVPDQNIVYIGAMRAPVLTASTTKLTIQVPPGCPYGPLCITVNARSSTSTQFFLTSYRSADTADGRHFVPGAVMPTTAGAAMATMADLDGDGKLDLLNSSQSEGSVAIFRNASTGPDLGQGALEPMVSFHTGNAVIVVNTGDVDGDGRLDILSANFTPYSLTVLRNVASPGSITVGSFVKTAEMVTGVDPMQSIADDLDGDGRIDIAVQNFTGHTVSLFRNTSTGPGSSASSFSPRSDLPTGLYPTGLAAGDMDGDGKTDLVVTAAKVHVHRNIATPGTLNDQSFAPAVEFTIGDGGWGTILGDVDDDGRLDVIVRLRDSSFAVLRNTSVPGEITAGSFAPPVKFQTLGYTYSLAVADFNGDGKLDVAAPSPTRKAMTVLYNQHRGTEILSSSFSEPVIVAQDVTAERVAAGDLDGDGRPDLAVIGPSVHLFRNSPPPVTSPPQLLAPSDSARGVSVPAALRWRPVRFAEGYHLQCALDTFSTLNTVLDTLVADTSALATALAYDTLYYWRVRGWNTTGYGPWAMPFMFRTVPPIPTTPLLQSPPNSATGQPLSLTLAWRPAAYALSYHVKAWSTIDSLLWPLLEDTAVVDTQMTLDTLRTGTWYSWTVRAKGHEGYGAWSPLWRFRTIVGPPFQVALRSPASGTIIQGDTIRVTWYGGQPEVTGYWVEVGTDSLFAFKSIDSTVADTTRVVRGLQKGLRYWWRVRARNAAGWGFFSESRQFSVSLTGVEHDAEIPDSYMIFQNYPNPFNPSTTIRYGLPRKSVVTLSVFNTLGQQVAVLVSGELDAGFHEVQFDGSAFASGVYFYRLNASPADNTRAADFIGMHKLLLVK